MHHFSKVKEALEYIDTHLEEPMSLKAVSERFHFSPYYFHRMFAMIVGKTMAVHVRDRRLMLACVQLSATENPVLDIALASGFNSAQSFSRAFKNQYGVSPREYRNQGFQPEYTTIDEMIMRFTNRLKGGVYLNPNIIEKKQMILATTFGDGNETMQVWQAFEKLSTEKPLTNKVSAHSYEVRVYAGEKCTVYTGAAVADENVAENYTIFKLPKSKYAAFDVYVANGYESENSAMDEWLGTNKEGYSERLLDDKHYCVEFYDERFNGSEAGSIVEIWIPIEKKST